MTINRLSAVARLIAVAAACLGPAAVAQSQPANAPAAGRTEPFFQIVVTPTNIPNPPFSGRLTIYMIKQGPEKANVDRKLGPADGPFFTDPQPMFSMEVKDLKEGDQIRFRPDQTFPFPLKDLPPGRYWAGAVLDRGREHSSWQKEGMNLSSPYVNFEVVEGKETFARFELVENPERLPKVIKDFEYFTVKSDALSKFRGKDVTLKAGVVFPTNYDPSKTYPAVYWVHGFPSTSDYGGDWRDAEREAWIRMNKSRPTHPVFENAFFIALDAQGPFGHTLLADSANNGPVSQALLTELIPALESKFRLIAKPEARVLRGHSSGGWSAIWLTLNHPEVFGAAWASCPDPVDFRAFQASNIYDQKNIFTGADGKDTPSYRQGGKNLMTVRQENAMERVLGPNGESGQQWSSWQAVFGPRGDNGNPKPLFNIATGAIDQSVAEAWKKYDISLLVKSDPAKFGPVFRDRIRIVAAENDNFFLGESVKMLAKTLEGAKMLGARGTGGYVEVRPNEDHGTLASDAAFNKLWDEVLEHWKRSKMVP